jgi:hypothetical protein
VPRRREQWASDQLTVQRRLAHRDPSLWRAAISANITGSRADVLVCDDVEVPNTADTAEKRRPQGAAARDRLRARAGGTRLYVGTPHSYYSIYADEARPEVGETVPFLAASSGSWCRS